jgi:copper chaperone NosL
MRIVVLLAALLLASCRDDVAALPDPVAITADATAHFCKMAIIEMPGPKAQIFLEGTPEPLFFAQVRDGVAYLKSPEKTAPVLAIYVSDMGRAVSWQQPGLDNWTDARTAYFVVGGDVTGGMGAPELAPFSERDAALAFAALHGGAVMGLDAIPDDAVLAPVEMPDNKGT